MTPIPHLVSLGHAQMNVLARHAYEHEAQHNTADKAMLKDDIANLRRTLDKLDKELDEEEQHDGRRANG